MRSCYWPLIYNCITTLKSGYGQLQYTYMVWLKYCYNLFSLTFNHLLFACVFIFGVNSPTHKYFLCVTCSPCELIWHPSSTLSQDGDTALMIASSKGHSSVVRKLLQAGATVNTANKVLYRVSRLYVLVNPPHLGSMEYNA